MIIYIQSSSGGDKQTEQKKQGGGGKKKNKSSADSGAGGTSLKEVCYIISGVIYNPRGSRIATSELFYLCNRQL